MNYLRLTAARNPDGSLYLEDGLIAFRLGLWVEGKEISSLHVNSGSLGLQTTSNLKTFQSPSSRPGSNEPIPEGEYGLGAPEFASPNSYSGTWGAGLGPVWFSINPKRAGARSSFGIHLDENRSYAPGSAGCVVTRTLADLKTVVAWWDKYKFKELIVDHGLGTVAKPSQPIPPSPPAKPPSPVSDFKIDVNQNGMTMTLHKVVPPGQYTIFSNEPSWSGKFKAQ